MKTLLRLALLALAAARLHAAAPVVTNVQASQIPGTKNIQITYNVSDADGDLQTIAVQVSGDAGLTYTIPATALSGHVGAGVAPGTGRTILWNAGVDWNGQYVPLAKVRITAHDGTTPPPPPGMVYIPAGVFQMGDNFNEIGTDTLPVHQVYVSGFFLDRFEATVEQWNSVSAWGMGHSYDLYLNSPLTGHPVRNISWYYAVKWCNARSEKEGLMPVYYTDDAQTLVYRSGDVDLSAAKVSWSANGYRLPTEAEWEKGARGGAMGLRYPWGDTIDGSHANYSGSGDAFETANPPSTPVGYYNGIQTPSGVDMVNGYGLYDMAGNVSEWCWDWYSGTYYGNASANSDPKGPTAATGQRNRRGGGWGESVPYLRCAQRLGFGPNFANPNVGFRCARTP